MFTLLHYFPFMIVIHDDPQQLKDVTYELGILVSSNTQINQQALC
jgi:hypothetical protein